MAELENSPLSLSFSGSGFLSVYQIGAVKALLDLAPDVLKNAPRVYGASAGSLIAAAVVFNTNLDELQEIIMDAANEARKPILGPFFPSFNLLAILKKTLNRFMPENAHQLASGRLHVALTRLSDGKTILVSDFKSKEEVLQALICSCFVPFYCGLVPPSFRGVRYIDGGLSNFQPLYELHSIITVSPFTGEIDICPRDCPVSHLCLHILNSSFQLSVQNICRVSYALFPPSSFVLNGFYYQGYRDAIVYLIRNGKHRLCLEDQNNINAVLKNKDDKMKQHEKLLVKKTNQYG
ncbi:PREDICTED: patatin-like phospholipase domain-containing protein 1 [Nanorana parkeri]|uniref:patatin-like phospholipase domain-containing protein 1 n=1 Tax=Nanorana parkeri TaxID=125878 RepID=UPI00085408B1|nr:PREDICTED: patatin-like phospholipase domain-containing protein 1 [Nanorana parkeri]